MMNVKIWKKSVVLGCLVMVLLLVIGCSGITGHFVNGAEKNVGDDSDISDSGVSTELEKVSVRLPIPVQDAAFAPFFVAVDKGFYAEEGIDVTFNFGSPDTNPPKMVATGADDFGVMGGPDTLLVARSRGLPLKAFGIMHQYSHFPVLISLKESELTKVEDLEGKKIGFFYGHISTDVLRNLFRKTGVEYEEVDIGFDFSQLQLGKIDAQFGFWSHAPFYFREKGVEVNIISPSDYGIDTHGYTLFTTERILEERPEVVEAFMKGTVKGMGYGVTYPEEAILSITHRDPNLNYDIELEKLLLYNGVMSEPYGYMAENMFVETYERLEEEGVLEKAFDVKEVYTTDILERVHENYEGYELS